MRNVTQTVTCSCIFLLATGCGLDDPPGRHVADVVVRDQAGSAVADAVVEFYFWEHEGDSDSGVFANRRCGTTDIDGRASQSIERPGKFLRSVDLVIHKEAYFCAWHQDPQNAAPCQHVFSENGTRSILTCVLVNCGAPCIAAPGTTCLCEANPPTTCVELDRVPFSDSPLAGACD